jgi:hypothetical protein
MKGQRARGQINFHEFRMGGIAPKTLYRSSHPIIDADIRDARAIAKSVLKGKIGAVLNLSDTKAELKAMLRLSGHGIAGIAAFAPWYQDLFASDCVIALNMNFDYLSSRFCAKLHRGIQFMLTHDRPCLVHCYAGVDRTGFVCAVLGALMGAKLREIVDDYVNFYNDYTMTKKEHKEYAQIIVDLFLEMNNGEEVNGKNLQPIAEDFLKQKVKLTNKELVELKEKLSIKKDLF